MPEPSRTDFGNFLHLRYMLGGMAQLLDDFWVRAIEHSKEDRLPALDDDAEDRSGNK